MSSFSKIRSLFSRSKRQGDSKTLGEEDETFGENSVRLQQMWMAYESASGGGSGKGDMIEADKRLDELIHVLWETSRTNGLPQFPTKVTKVIAERRLQPTLTSVTQYVNKVGDLDCDISPHSQLMLEVFNLLASSHHRSVLFSQIGAKFFGVTLQACIFRKRKEMERKPLSANNARDEPNPRLQQILVTLLNILSNCMVTQSFFQRISDLPVSLSPLSPYSLFGELSCSASNRDLDAFLAVDIFQVLLDLLQLDRDGVSNESEFELSRLLLACIASAISQNKKANEAFEQQGILVVCKKFGWPSAQDIETSSIRTFQLQIASLQTLQAFFLLAVECDRRISFPDETVAQIGRIFMWASVHLRSSDATNRRPSTADADLEYCEVQPEHVISSFGRKRHRLHSMENCFKLCCFTPQNKFSQGIWRFSDDGSRLEFIAGKPLMNERDDDSAFIARPNDALSAVFHAVAGLICVLEGRQKPTKGSAANSTDWITSLREKLFMSVVNLFDETESLRDAKEGQCRELLGTQAAELQFHFLPFCLRIARINKTMRETVTKSGIFRVIFSLFFLKHSGAVHESVLNSCVERQVFVTAMRGAVTTFVKQMIDTYANDSNFTVYFELIKTLENHSPKSEPLAGAFLSGAVGLFQARSSQTGSIAGAPAPGTPVGLVGAGFGGNARERVLSNSSVTSTDSAGGGGAGTQPTPGMPVGLFGLMGSPPPSASPVLGSSFRSSQVGGIDEHGGSGVTADDVDIVGRVCSCLRHLVMADENSRKLEMQSGATAKRRKAQLGAVTTIFSCLMRYMQILQTTLNSENPETDAAAAAASAEGTNPRDDLCCSTRATANDLQRCIAELCMVLDAITGNDANACMEFLRATSESIFWNASIKKWERGLVDGAPKYKPVAIILLRLLEAPMLRQWAMRHVCQIMKLQVNEVHLRVIKNLYRRYVKLFAKILATSNEFGRHMIFDRNMLDFMELLLAGVRVVCYRSHSAAEGAQNTFVESSILIQMVAFFSQPGTDEAVESMLVAVLSAFTALLARNSHTKSEFAASVSYHGLHKLLLLAQPSPSMQVARAVLDMVVEEEFDEEGRCTIHNSDAAKLLVKLIQNAHIDVQKEIMSSIYKLTARSVNRSACCDIQLTSTLLQWLRAMQQEGKYEPSELTDRITAVIEALGRHSITVRELRILFSLLRNRDNSARPATSPNLLKALKGMSSSRNAPPAFFEFDGTTSALRLPEYDRLFKGNGFTFATWICFDGDSLVPESNSQVLFALQSSSGRGIQVWLGHKMMTFFVRTKGGDDYTHASSLSPDKWHHICFVYNPGSFLGGKSELIIYIDGKMKKRPTLKFPDVGNIRCNVVGSCFYAPPQSDRLYLLTADDGDPMESEDEQQQQQQQQGRANRRNTGASPEEESLNDSADGPTTAAATNNSHSSDGVAAKTAQPQVVFNSARGSDSGKKRYRITRPSPEAAAAILASREGDKSSSPSASSAGGGSGSAAAAGSSAAAAAAAATRMRPPVDAAGNPLVPLRAQMGSIYLFDEALPRWQVEVIHRYGPSFLLSSSVSDSAELARDPDLAVVSKLQPYSLFTARGVKDDIVFDLAPDASSRETGNANRVGELRCSVARKMPSSLACLGGTKVFLPLLYQLQLPAAPLIPGDLLDYTVDEQLSANILFLINKAISTGNSNKTKQELPPHRLFPIISFLLCQASPQHLTLEMLIELQHLLAACLQIEHKYLNSPTNILLDFRLWIFGSTAVQEKVLQLLGNVYLQAKGFRPHGTLQSMLDIAQQFYWEVHPESPLPAFGATGWAMQSQDGGEPQIVATRPSLPEITSLRSKLFKLLSDLLNPDTVTPAEISMFLRYLAFCKDPSQLADVTILLYKLCVNSVKVCQGLATSDVGGAHVLLSLLDCPRDDVRHNVMLILYVLRPYILSSVLSESGISLVFETSLGKFEITEFVLVDLLRLMLPDTPDAPKLTPENFSILRETPRDRGLLLPNIAPAFITLAGSANPSLRDAALRCMVPIMGTIMLPVKENEDLLASSLIWTLPLLKLLRETFSADAVFGTDFKGQGGIANGAGGSRKYSASSANSSGSSGGNNTSGYYFAGNVNNNQQQPIGSLASRMSRSRKRSLYGLGDGGGNLDGSASSNHSSGSSPMSGKQSRSGTTSSQNSGKFVGNNPRIPPSSSMIPIPGSGVEGGAVDGKNNALVGDGEIASGDAFFQMLESMDCAELVFVLLSAAHATFLRGFKRGWQVVESTMHKLCLHIAPSRAWTIAVKLRLLLDALEVFYQDASEASEVWKTKGAKYYGDNLHNILYLVEDLCYGGEESEEELAGHDGIAGASPNNNEFHLPPARLSEEGPVQITSEAAAATTTTISKSESTDQLELSAISEKSCTDGGSSGGDVGVSNDNNNNNNTNNTISSPNPLLRKGTSSLSSTPRTPPSSRGVASAASAGAGFAAGFVPLKDRAMDCLVRDGMILSDPSQSKSPQQQQQQQQQDGEEDIIDNVDDVRRVSSGSVGSDAETLASAITAAPAPPPPEDAYASTSSSTAPSVPPPRQKMENIPYRPNSTTDTSVFMSGGSSTVAANDRSSMTGVRNSPAMSYRFSQGIEATTTTSSFTLLIEDETTPLIRSEDGSWAHMELALLATDLYAEGQNMFKNLAARTKTSNDVSKSIMRTGGAARIILRLLRTIIIETRDEDTIAMCLQRMRQILVQDQVEQVDIIAYCSFLGELALLLGRLSEWKLQINAFEALHSVLVSREVMKTVPIMSTGSSLETGGGGGGAAGGAPSSSASGGGLSRLPSASSVGFSAAVASLNQQQQQQQQYNSGASAISTLSSASSFSVGGGGGNATLSNVFFHPSSWPISQPDAISMQHSHFLALYAYSSDFLQVFSRHLSPKVAVVRSDERRIWAKMRARKKQLEDRLGTNLLDLQTDAMDKVCDLRAICEAFIDQYREEEKHRFKLLLYATREARVKASRQWKTLWRSLSNERGPWGARDPSGGTQPAYTWKLDKYENSDRARLLLRRKYDSCLHREASLKAASTGPPIAPLDVEMQQTRRLIILPGGAVKADNSDDDLAFAGIDFADLEGIAAAAAADKTGAAAAANDKEDIGGDDDDDQLESGREKLSLTCRLIRTKGPSRGKLLFTTTSLIFQPDMEDEGTSADNDNNNNNNNNTYTNSNDSKRPVEKCPCVLAKNERRALPINQITWSLKSVQEVQLRLYTLQPVAVELFLENHTACLIAFDSVRERSKAISTIVSTHPNSKSVFLSEKAKKQRMQETQEKWCRGEMSNFAYLMFLNTMAGRTFNDLAQYPVFPWILADYESPKLDFKNEKKTFRDLTKPIGALNPVRKEYYIERYTSFEDPSSDVPQRYHYCTHYSAPASICFYLLRLEPFTTLHIELQSGKFDHADRLFDSVGSAWHQVTHLVSDVKELIPEFFCLPDFLINHNGFDLGVKQTGERVSDVKLPPWAKNADEFVRIHREALESDYVSANLNSWIDLIFGFAQRGQAAVDAINTFHFLSYEGSVDFEKITDPHQLAATIDQINNFGQTPCRLFTKPHPVRSTKGVEDRRRRQGWEMHGFRCGFRIGGDGDYFSSSSSSFATIAVMPLSDRIFTLSSNRILSTHDWTPIPQHISDLPFGLTIEAPDSRKRKIGAPQQERRTNIVHGMHVLSPGGKMIISCGHWDNSFKVTATDGSGRLIQSVVAHQDVVTCLALSRDGRTLVTGSADTTVMIWKVDPTALERSSGGVPISERNRRMISGHDDEVTFVAINKDCNMIASASQDGTVLIHTLRGAYVRSIPNPSNSFTRGFVLPSKRVSYTSQPNGAAATATTNDDAAAAAVAPPLDAVDPPTTEKSGDDGNSNSNNNNDNNDDDDDDDAVLPREEEDGAEQQQEEEEGEEQQEEDKEKVSESSDPAAAAPPPPVDEATAAAERDAALEEAFAKVERETIISMPAPDSSNNNNTDQKQDDSANNNNNNNNTSSATSSAAVAVSSASSSRMSTANNNPAEGMAMAGVAPIIPVDMVQLSSNGDVFMFSRRDMGLHAFCCNGRHLATVDASEQPLTMIVDSSGKFLISAGSKRQVIVRNTWNLRTVLKYDTIDAPILSLALSVDESHLFAGGLDGSLFVFPFGPAIFDDMLQLQNKKLSDFLDSSTGGFYN